LAPNSCCSTSNCSASMVSEVRTETLMPHRIRPHEGTRGGA
jgi:hypothetical protein